MANVCEICGKGVRSGSIIVRHGLRKAKGGIGLHTTGISKRRFLPNVNRVRVRVNGTNKRMKVCAGCIKSGCVTKP